MADTKISDETAAGALDGTEIVPVVRVTPGSPTTYANRQTTTGAIADELSGMKLVDSQAASGSATNIAFTGLTGDRYLLVLENIVPATAGADLLVQLGEGGTPTYETANYNNVYTYTGIDVVDGGVTRINPATGIANAAGVSNTVGCVYGRIQFNGIAQAQRHAAEFSFVLHANGNSKYYDIRGAGVLSDDTNAITAIRIITSSGNISAGGKASLYQLN